MNSIDNYRGYTVGTAITIHISSRLVKDGNGARYTFVKGHNGTWKCFDFEQEPFIPDGGAYTSDDLTGYIRMGDWVVEKVFGIENSVVEHHSLFARIRTLQIRGVQVLFDTDLTVNIRGMQGGTLMGILGLCRTEEELETALTRAEKEFGITT